ncbi:MAG: ABC transporter permease [Phycisphaerales bacterium]
MSGVRVILVLAWKDLRLLLRDKAAFFFTAIFPLVFGVLFGAVFSGAAGGDGPQSLGVAIADLDRTEDSRALLDTFIADSRLDATNVIDAHEARELVRKGSAEAFIVIPAGFADAARMPFGGTPMRLEIGSGPSGRATRGLLTGIATQKLYQHLQSGMVDPERATDMLQEARRAMAVAEGVDAPQRLALQGLLTAAERAIVDMPADDAADDANAGGFNVVTIEQTEVTGDDAGDTPEALTISAFAITFPQAILWAVMGCAAGFGVSLVTERTGGTMTRLRVAPIGRWHIVLGKACACLITTLVVSSVLLLLAWIAFGVRPVAPFMLVLAVLAVALCFVGIMMLLAVVGTTEAAASGIGWACLLTLAMIGGGAIPLAFMPAWLRDIGHISPVKWGITAIEGGLWRGLSPAEMMLPIGVLLGMGTLSFTIGAVVFARRETR